MSFDSLHSALQHHIVNSLGWRKLRPLQEEAISPLLAGEDAILLAPTAGGKTEAAIFPTLSRMLSEDWQGLSVLYVCPIKALLNNLHERLEHYAGLLGRTVAVWHGDVGESGRQATRREPPDILLTTPESIEAQLLSSKTDNEAFFGRVRTVIIDEVHAFAGDDRGWHLLGVLSRIEALSQQPIQRIGCSATVGNPDELLGWLSPAGRSGQVLNPPAEHLADPELTVDYVGSVENAARVIAALHRGRKRLVFCDSRARVEDLAVSLRNLGVDTFVSHSSLSLTERKDAERAFAEASDCVIVATSTLELGIDVGDLDHVIQIDAPGSVASFLQRIGRTGRREGTSRNCLFLATSEDALVRATALVYLFESGWVEPVTPPPWPLHILAQQIMAMALQDGGFTWQSWREPVAIFLKQADIPEADGESIILAMVERGLLFEDGGVYWFAEEGERIFGRRHFSDLMAVFTAEPLLKVLHGRKEIGQAHPLSFRGEQRSRPLALGGRSWVVIDVDWKRRVVSVQPSSDRGRIRFLGDPVPRSFEFCRACRDVICLAESWEWLSSRGIERLSDIRDSQGYLQINSNVMTGNDERVVWWTHAGLLANQRILEMLLAETGQTGSATNECIVLNDSGSPHAIADIVRSEEFANRTPEDGLQEVPVKFRECLSPALLMKMWKGRCGAGTTIRAVLNEPTQAVNSYSDS